MKKLILAILLPVQAVVCAQPSDSYLKSRLDAERIPGASFAIVKDTNLVYTSSVGKADLAQNKDMNRHRMFVLSSVSNMVTATAVMQLWEKGLVQMDADVNNYLPFKLTHPYYPNDTITMYRLLTHTAAIDDNWGVLVPLFSNGDAMVTLGDFVKGYFGAGGAYYNTAGNFVNQKPGAQWRFSNMGMILAAYVVERVTGDAYAHYCDTAIFKQLCMNNSSFAIAGIQDTGMIARPYSWTGTAYADNGLYGFPGYPGFMLRSSCTDMTRLMAMYVNYGMYKGKKILDSATVAYIMQPHTAALSVPAPGLLYQGLGFIARQTGSGDTIMGMEGTSNGGLAAMYIGYKHRAGVLLLGNSEGVNNPLLIMDTLYKYGVAKTPAANDTFPACDEPTRAGELYSPGYEVSVYPNPACGYVSVHVQVEGRMLLVNLQGRHVQEYILHKGNNQVVLPESAKGLYFARILDKAGRVYEVETLICIDK